MGDDRPEDLGALLGRAQRAVADREEGILRAHGVSMWEYVIMSGVAAQDGVTQKDLARTTRRDPTRLGANLDALGGRGLVDRAVDPGDRRRQVVRLTEDGRRLFGTLRAEIAEMEHALFGPSAGELRGALTAALDGSDPSGR